ncbi:hypothetical protein C0Q70_15097 [Pomacea canaliculata]|uniref:Globin n=1 Tax=Pomacea canaliculata TaxID=400727 RepID=A0A2T7NTY6_POMCA|nr:hypothetical protein C0Q70_15097 [Pomacea canaliculata]
METATDDNAGRDPVTGLRSCDRSAIRDSWVIVSEDKIGNGLRLMLKFFEDYPDNQNFFPDFRGRALEELRECPSLQQHGLRVMGALTSIVDSIDDAGVLVGVLHRTVDSHLTRGVRAAQFAELIEVFARFLASTLGDRFTPSMGEAWTTAATTILAVVKARVQDQLTTLPASSTPLK